MYEMMRKLEESRHLYPLLDCGSFFQPIWCTLHVDSRHLSLCADSKRSITQRRTLSGENTVGCKRRVGVFIIGAFFSSELCNNLQQLSIHYTYQFIKPFTLINQYIFHSLQLSLLGGLIFGNSHKLLFWICWRTILQWHFLGEL